jgi:hypothetical protein
VKKKRQQSEIVIKSERHDRAEYCTNYLKTFEDCCRNWVDLAVVLLEVERDELFLEVGSKTWDDWARTHAPVSYRLCYMIKARYKALKESFSDVELKKMPPETASWASRSKNISPAALQKPEVKSALMLPKQKAVKLIKESCPEQHVEDECKITCKFAASAYEVIQKAYQTFKMVKDERASFEEFLEYCVSEWVLAVGKS